MQNIKLSLTTSDGRAGFKIDGVPYYYDGIDGVYILKIKTLSSKGASGKALGIAKRECTFWKKDGGEWQDNNPH